MAKSGISERTNLAFPGVQSVPKKIGGQKKKRQALKKTAAHESRVFTKQLKSPAKS